MLETSAMDQRDQELLDKQMRAISPDRGATAWLL
jgi:hypothetical protein